MNNYIDEKMISYRRPYRTSAIIKTTKTSRENTLVSLAKKAVLGAAKVLAVIFLLVVSTFSGVGENNTKTKSDVSVKKATRNLLLCIGLVLTVWVALVCLDYVVSYATLMPVWFFIGGFALIVLSLSKLVSK